VNFTYIIIYKNKGNNKAGLIYEINTVVGSSGHVECKAGRNASNCHVNICQGLDDICGYTTD
jgi:hypothetical protein